MYEKKNAVYYFHISFPSREYLKRCLANFKQCLEAHGYPKKYVYRKFLVRGHLSALKLQKQHNTAERLLPFVTTYHPVVKKLKQIVMENWRFIENQPLLKTIFKTPPIISYKRGKSLKDMLVRAKL